MKRFNRELLIDTIRHKRKDKNLTQNELADLAKINRSMVGRIENGMYVPSIDQLERLAEILEFELTDLFQDHHNPDQSKITEKPFNIAVAGTGYVGLSIATLLAQHNHVTAVDIVPEKVDMINERKSPIQDDYIEKYLAEKELDLTATLDGEAAYRDADFVVIAAPTNYDSKKKLFRYQCSGDGDSAGEEREPGRCHGDQIHHSRGIHRKCEGEIWDRQNHLQS